MTEELTEDKITKIMSALSVIESQANDSYPTWASHDEDTFYEASELIEKSRDLILDALVTKMLKDKERIKN